MTRTTTAADTLIAGIDLAGLVDRELSRAQIGSPATLHKRASRVVATADPAGGTRSIETDIPCRGIRSEVASPGARTVTVTLFGASIVLAGARVIPEPGDAVTIRGERFEIAGDVEDDPAAATYTFTATAPGAGPR